MGDFFNRCCDTDALVFLGLVWAQIGTVGGGGGGGGRQGEGRITISFCYLLLVNFKQDHIAGKTDY